MITVAGGVPLQLILRFDTTGKCALMRFPYVSVEMQKREMELWTRITRTYIHVFILRYDNVMLLQFTLKMSEHSINN